jgi:chromosome partitioning protein
VRLVVAGLKGGVGKTTSAVYLSAVARRHGLVTLVDADPQASAAEWLEERPLEGVVVVEAPSERLLVRALERAEGASVVVDTPPGSERLVRAAVEAADAVVIPTRAGGLEASRVHATLGLLPDGLRRGVVVTAARLHTRDYRETVEAWIEAGLPVWGSVPERVAVAAGPSAELAPEALEVYREVLAAARRRGGRRARA